MNDFNDMKNLFEKLGIEYNVTEGKDFDEIKILDCVGSGEFYFDKNGIYQTTSFFSENDD